MSLFKSPTIWTGNTYPIREEIKALGGVWDKEKRAWLVPRLSMAERTKVGRINMRGVRVEVQK